MLPFPKDLEFSYPFALEHLCIGASSRGSLFPHSTKADDFAKHIRIQSYSYRDLSHKDISRLKSDIHLPLELGARDCLSSQPKSWRIPSKSPRSLINFSDASDQRDI